ncbi:MAG: ThuA domain-containing protein [Planctomycetes bacterium]|nr:ThuA domain-containing protein [Planctomycetota bacterium]
MLGGCASQPAPILVFTKTTAFRHKNISEGVQALREIGSGKFTVEHTEDAGAFTADNLRRFPAVVFLSTTGDVLNEDQQKAFEQYIHAGGGFVGIHAAADTEYGWPWYGELVGAWFKDHTEVIAATVHREDSTHISTAHFPDSWKSMDEWYRFQSNPRHKVHVLLTVDDGDLGVVTMNGDHPIAWMHEFEGGRAWYTAMGHTKELFAQPEFRNHVLGGILWAMHAAP